MRAAWLSAVQPFPLGDPTMKKTLLLCAVLAILLSMTAPAYAEGESGGRVEIAASATYRDVPIQVTVPAEKKLYINPLQFPIKVNGKKETSQILSDPAYIENQSEVPVSVNVSVTGTIFDSSNMLLASNPVKETGTTSKKAFVYFEIKAADDPDQVSWDSTFDPEKHLAVRTYARSRKNIAELSEAGGSAPYGAFRLSGDCVCLPKIPWTEADGLKVVVVFTFKALPLSA